MLDLEGLMIFFRIKFYFYIIDTNYKKAFEHSNQVRKLILKEEKENISACC